MDSVFPSLVTVAAVIVGGMITFLTTWFMEGRRTARERSERWDVRRLEVLGDFARAVKEETRLLLRIAGHHGFGKTLPLSPAKGRRLHQIAEHERSLSFESVLLLADAETVAAAQGWYLSAWDLQRFLLDPDVERTQERFDQLYSTTNDMREAFHHAARRSLDVNRGSGPIDLRPRSDREKKY